MSWRRLMRPALGKVEHAALTVEQVNAINLGLVLLSAAVAWVRPLELFLLSYAVLGPLHYLTEISWLHDRGYFTRARHDALPLLVLGVMAFLARYTHLMAWDGATVLALALSAALVLAPTARSRVALALGAGVVTWMLERWGAGWLFLVVLLPTVIHVFFFTGVFMLYGSVRARSAWGYASFAVFVVCGAALFLVRLPAAHYAVGPHIPALIEEFSPVIDRLAVPSPRPLPWEDLVAIGRFLAFAYTYHYLNWFSKTGVIRWHTVGGRRLAAIGAAYVVALALYGWDYRLGLATFALLSMLHVLLEFPLDLRTMAALGARAIQT